MNSSSSWLRNSVALVLLAAAPPAAGAQSQLKKQIIPPVSPPHLDVKEFSGDFTQWGPSAALADGGLVKEFRWSTVRKDAATARYEVAYGLGKSAVKEMLVPKPLGSFGFFSIDFTPLLADLAASPSRTKLFHVRVVLLDLQGKPLHPVSRTVTLNYHPPAGGTRLDSSMALVLTSVKCFTVTSGPGTDEIRIRVDLASFTASGSSTVLFEHLHDFDPGTVITPGVIHEFTGLSFPKNVVVIVGLAEDDPPSYIGILGTSGTKAQNGPGVLDSLGRVLCAHDNSEDDCIGTPQVLPVSESDWHTIVDGKKKSLQRVLTFEGDGARYQFIFELRKGS
jgi:hypothetical protein